VRRNSAEAGSKRSVALLTNLEEDTRRLEAGLKNSRTPTFTYINSTTNQDRAETQGLNNQGQTS